MLDSEIQGPFGTLVLWRDLIMLRRREELEKKEAIFFETKSLFKEYIDKKLASIVGPMV